MFELIRRLTVALQHRRRPFGPPEDPYAAVREPRRRNPGGRSCAIALAEPEARTFVRAVGTLETSSPSYSYDDA
jgi:hypothetical protein